MSPNNVNTEPQFTKGEKCIFTHLVVTFSLILVLIITYFIHLLVVTHTPGEEMRISRRSNVEVSGPRADYLPVGAVYLNTNPKRIICNSLLFRQTWSLAPAHCVSARSNSDLSVLLPNWKIIYIFSPTHYEVTEIVRGVIHPHFNKVDFRNNIGLFEHTKSITKYQHVFPDTFIINDDTLQLFVDDMEIVSWNNKLDKSYGKYEKVHAVSVQPVASDECFKVVSPITELRDYEFCVKLKEKEEEVILEHGAVFIANNTIVGLFSWSDKQGRMIPFILLNISYFKDWLEDVTTLFL